MQLLNKRNIAKTTLILLGVFLVMCMWSRSFLGALAIGIVFLLNYLALFPVDITFRLAEDGKKGVMDFGQKKSIALLIISKKEIEESSKKNEFHKQDWSLAWINTLFQEVGSYSVCDIKKLDKATLRDKKLVIISKSASKSLSFEAYNLLKSFRNILIVDFPTSDYAQKLCGIKVKDIRTAHQVTDSFIAELKDLPISTRLLKIEKPNLIESCLRIDHEPAICHKENLLFLLFDYTQQLMSLQQGVPQKGYSVKKKYSTKRLSSTNLVMSKRLLDNFVPYAHLLEKAIFNIIEKYAPIPRLWYFPFDYNGIGILTHDEDEYGDKSTFVSDYEGNLGVTSTFFIVPNSQISGKAIEKISKFSQIGIHWNRYAIKKPILLKFFKPIGKKISLKEQIINLKNKFPSLGKPLVCRNDGLLWDGDYTNTFRVLYAHDIKVDSTYGPYGGLSGSPSYKGYLFGTGFPFHPIDKNGLPFPIYECPHIVGDYGNVSQQDLLRFIKESAEKYHEVLTLLYHPIHIENDVKIREQWTKSFNLLRKHKHWIANFKDLYKWLKARNSTWYNFRLDGGKLIIKFVSNSNQIAFIIPESFKAEDRGIKKREITQLGKKYILVSTKTKKGEIVCQRIKP